MTDSSNDRNVLFGVTAWQMGLVDRETVMSAMYAWMTDKSQSLPDVLEKSGKLSADDRRRLEELVELQARKFGGDAGRTLAGLSSVESIRNDLEHIVHFQNMPTVAENEPVDRKAATVASDHPTVDGNPKTDVVLAGESPAPSAAEPSGSRARFHVLRAHARGGLGEVFVAMDEELRREVALKQMLPKHAANPSSRTRFLREAEVTGNLEHPGVVPVYGLGTEGDGRPFYAMRFIRGESLEDAIQHFHSDGGPLRSEGERAVELRNLLTRFVAVCNTIEYAHSRGIIHRDLKPENIMLGPYGETLVVDWGLARPVDSADVEISIDGEPTAEESSTASQTIARPTQIGTVIGTPQFMSPEQAAGRIDLMTPASDIYSLGATLYCLLTDQPPFTSANVRKVLDEVQAGRFPPPRQVNRDVPHALEAICLKAMALRTENRYRSARAMADDIEHWMADEPVTALRETPLERLARWMRRHKTWTQAGAAAAIVIAMVTVVAYVREAALHTLVQKSLEDEQRARQDADVARKAADDNALLARQEKKSAEEHAVRAQKQTDLALATLKSVLFDIQLKLRNVPAAQTARQSMLNTVIDGLTKVARSLETATDTDHSLVQAHLYLGDTFLEIGAGENTSATEEATRQFQLAATVAENVFAAHPTSIEAKADLGAAYQRLGDVALQAGNVSAAGEWFRTSLKLRDELATAKPDDAAVLLELADSVQRLGMQQERLDDLADAKKSYARFLELTQRLTALEPKNSEYQRKLSVAFERMGDLSLSQGEDVQAAAYFEKCLEVRQRLVQTSSNSFQAERDMSVTLDRLGDVALRRDDVKSAEDYYRRSLESRKKLAGEDPENVQVQRDMLVSYRRLGDVAQRRNDAAAAEEHFRRYHEIALKLALGDPANVEFQRDLATSYESRGYIFYQAEKWGEAREMYGKHIEIVRRLADGDPANPQYRNDLAAGFGMLSDIDRRLGDWSAVHGELAEYVDFARKRIAAAPGDHAAQKILADALLRAGDASLQVGDTATAALQLTEGRRLAETIRAEAPGDEAATVVAASFASLLVQLSIEDRDPDQAAQWVRRGIEELKPVADAATGSQREAYLAAIKEQETLGKLCAQASKAQKNEEAATGEEAEAELLDFRAAALERAGKFDEAEAAAEKIAGDKSADGAAWFLAARRLASLASHGDDGGKKPPSEAAQRCADRAMALLQQAADAGHFNNALTVARLQFASDLASLRNREDFRKLLERMQKAARRATTSESK